MLSFLFLFQLIPQYAALLSLQLEDVSFTKFQALLLNFEIQSFNEFQFCTGVARLAYLAVRNLKIALFYCVNNCLIPELSLR